MVLAGVGTRGSSGISQRLKPGRVPSHIRDADLVLALPSEGNPLPRLRPPDVLKPEELAKPVPRDDEVLIRVRAASVNRESEIRRAPGGHQHAGSPASANGFRRDRSAICFE